MRFLQAVFWESLPLPASGFIGVLSIGCFLRDAWESGWILLFEVLILWAMEVLFWNGE